MKDWQLQPARDHGLSLAERAKSLNREQGLIDRLFNRLWYVSVCCYMKLMHSLRVEQIEHLPAHTPFVLVANHTSHLDALTLFAALPRKLSRVAFPVAAGDTFFETQPVAIFAATFINALPIWRKNCGSHALEQLRERLTHDRCIYILFPEGGRSRDGVMQPFKAGIGRLICGSDVAVVPCHLDGCFEALPPDSKRPRRRRVTVRIGKPLSFADQPNAREGWQHAATALENAVRALAPPRA